MQGFICLGAQRELAREEFASLCPDWRVVGEGTDTILVEGDSLPLLALQGRAGGVVKTGSLYTFVETDAELADAMAGLAVVVRPEESRLVFGVSVHSAGDTMRAQGMRKGVERLGMEVKKRIEAMGKTARFVPSITPGLSTVIIVKQKLTTTGIDFCLLAVRGGWWIGITETVQDFEEWARRDMGRPGRDAKRGMLPPKLARTLLNLAAVGEGSAVLDPYCGGGTVLTEAMALGAGRIVGSDRDPAAIVQARKNVFWENGGAWPAQVELIEAPAETVSERLPDQLFDAIVGEGFLGEPKQGDESLEILQTEIDHLGRQYAQVLPLLFPLLKPGGCLLLALPAFRLPHGDTLGVSVSFAAQSAGLEPFPFAHARHLTPEGALRYGRPSQWVWRDIYRWKRP
jgi:tRNA G10  N-methylase Trm11